MRSAIVAALLFLFAGGCEGWQANRSSQAVDINQNAIGTGRPAMQPASGAGFMDGQPQNMRSR